MSTSTRVISHKSEDTDKGISLKYQSPEKALNLADGPTLRNPDKQIIYAAPTFEKWVGSVGLQGAENKFIEYSFVDVNDLYAAICLDDDGYECGYYSRQAEIDQGYSSLLFTEGHYPAVNTYDQAIWNKGGIPEYGNLKSFMSVEIINHGTNNIYNDNWLDVRLYGKDRQLHPYSKMYIPVAEKFYAGFHARNTRELPYNIEIQIAKNIVPMSRIEDKRLIRRTIEFGTQY